MTGMFSYRENVARLARMDERRERLERRARLTDEQLLELEQLREWIAELEASLREWQRL